MASEADSGQLPPAAGAPEPGFTHFADPTPANPPGEPDWSEPIPDDARREPAWSEPPPGNPPGETGWSAPPPGETDWSEPTLIQRAAEEPVAPFPHEFPAGPPVAYGAPPAGYGTNDEPGDPLPFDEPDERTQPDGLTQPAPPTLPADAEQSPPPGSPEPDPGFYYVPAGPRRRRATYREGSVAAWHPVLVERAADVAVAAMPIPLRVLDVGCGDGQLLAELILRVPYADIYVGLDPMPGVISDVRRASDPRLSLVRGAAEALPFADGCFDLVLATMSFGYWEDQAAGVAELARVVSDTGKVVIVEPPNAAGNVTKLLAAAGLTLERTETVHRSRLLLPQARAFIAAL
jgi:SAM-dependent methyltransferase